jgi:hypothetical protein
MGGQMKITGTQVPPIPVYLAPVQLNRREAMPASLLSAGKLHAKYILQVKLQD